MMQFIQTLMRPFARFAKDDHASITVEAILVLPLLLWGYFGMFILFDGYRALSANIRTSYTISDMLSREDNPIDQAYLDGLNDIQDILTQSSSRTVLRVTVAKYRDLNGNNQVDAGEHSMEWSHSTEGKLPATEAEFQDAIVKHLPIMQDSDILLVVETWMAFVPFMNITLEQLYSSEASERVGFGPFYFEGLVTTRKRFTNQMCWEQCY